MEAGGWTVERRRLDLGALLPWRPGRTDGGQRVDVDPLRHQLQACSCYLAVAGMLAAVNVNVREWLGAGGWGIDWRTERLGLQLQVSIYILKHRWALDGPN